MRINKTTAVIGVTGAFLLLGGGLALAGTVNANSVPNSPIYPTVSPTVAPTTPDTSIPTGAPTTADTSIPTGAPTTIATLPVTSGATVITVTLTLPTVTAQPLN